MIQVSTHEEPNVEGVVDNVLLCSCKSSLSCATSLAARMSTRLISCRNWAVFLALCGIFGVMATCCTRWLYWCKAQGPCWKSCWCCVQHQHDMKATTARQALIAICVEGGDGIPPCWSKKRTAMRCEKLERETRVNSMTVTKSMHVSHSEKMGGLCDNRSYCVATR